MTAGKILVNKTGGSMNGDADDKLQDSSASLANTVSSCCKLLAGCLTCSLLRNVELLMTTRHSGGAGVKDDHLVAASHDFTWMSCRTSSTHVFRFLYHARRPFGLIVWLPTDGSSFTDDGYSMLVHLDGIFRSIEDDNLVVHGIVIEVAAD